jgi:hypothetical protein
MSPALIFRLLGLVPLRSEDRAPFPGPGTILAKRLIREELKMSPKSHFFLDKQKASGYFLSTLRSGGLGFRLGFRNLFKSAHFKGFEPLSLI